MLEGGGGVLEGGVRGGGGVFEEGVTIKESEFTGRSKVSKDG